MRVFILLVTIFLGYGSSVAQSSCLSTEYAKQAVEKNPALKNHLISIEQFIIKQSEEGRLDYVQRGDGAAVIRIPVVVHILYHQPSENISDERVFSQIAALNECFRRDNSDTINTPSYFKSLAADCQIEFQLATSDPIRRSTTGIIRKYTPVAQWNGDDNMKFSDQAGDNAWDADQYLNIWVCNLRLIAGYSSVPGGPKDKDGIVLHSTVFGKNGGGVNQMGKTAVHETGHWLGLKHIWGDSYCGDDGIDDTPQQGNFTTGCPTGIRSTCNNGAFGDMYMNYMDITSDKCTNLFTQGQKQRMHAVFAPGGPRYKLHSSIGLQPPLINEIPLPEPEPKWLHPQLYPNPAHNELTLDLSYDVRWIGTQLSITNAQGQTIIADKISSKVHTINISRLSPGLYFIYAKKSDGETIKQKFIKK